MPNSISITCLSALTAFAAFPSTPVPGQVANIAGAHQNAEKNEFIRLQRDAQNVPISLETAIRTYRPRTGDSGLRVDLVGAIHVGDHAYYQQLNKLFRQYDVVLYELVAPPGTVIPQGGQTTGSNPISMLQGMTKSMLNLASQTEEIDYTVPNFRHADMSPNQLTESMKKRGDTPMTVALSAMAEMMRNTNLKQQQQAEELPESQPAPNPLALLFDAQRDTKLKTMMAVQFSNLTTGAMGATLDQLIVKDRNAAAMKVFQKELSKGHARIAIFYGAAHLPDFEDRLIQEFDFVASQTQWLQAWDLKKPSKNANKQPDALDRLMRTLITPAVQ